MPSHSASPRPGARWLARLLAVGAALALAAAPGPCHAGLVVLVPDVTVVQGGTTSFDVVVTNDPDTGGDDVFVSGFSLDLSVAASGVQFTSATIGTTATYIFMTSGTTVEGSDPFVPQTFPNTNFTASDFEIGGEGFRTVPSGNTFGIARVTVMADPLATPGPRAITIGSTTGFADNGFPPNNISRMLVNGTVTVVPVPEPACVTLLFLGALGAGHTWRRWRQTKRSSAAA
jgi:hypothetical protein